MDRKAPNQGILKDFSLVDEHFPLIDCLVLLYENSEIFRLEGLEG